MLVYVWNVIVYRSHVFKNYNNTRSSICAFEKVSQKVLQQA